MIVNRTEDALDALPCTIYTEAVRDPSLEPHVIVSFAIIYSIQFILGVSGNLAVILFTYRNSRLQTVQNLFILNLALSDFVVCIVSLPITPITSIYKNWYFGNFLCHALPWIQGISVFIATFSLTAIALDRYFLIVRPLRKRLNKNEAKYVMIVLWIASALITLPYAANMKLTEIDTLCGMFCSEDWISASSRRTYTVVVLLFQFVLPFLIMGFCYFRIFQRLQERTNAKIRKLNERSLILATSMPIMSTVKRKISEPVDIMAQCRQKCELLRQTRRNTFVLLSMVVLFGVSWFPQNVANLILEFAEFQFVEFEDGEIKHDYSYLVSLVTHSIAMMNTVVNPVLYGALNPLFIEMLRKTCSDWKNSFSKLRRLETISSNTTLV